MASSNNYVVVLFLNIIYISKKRKKSDETKLMLEILNLAEGKLDLLEICERKNYKFIDFLNLYKKLLKSGYIKKS